MNRAQLEKRLTALEAQLVVPPVRPSRVLERLSQQEFDRLALLVETESAELEQVWAGLVKAHSGEELS